MALSQRLDIRQSQSLVMTPQLQQAIKLLQMSNLEVADFIAAEIEQNPLLERAEFAMDGEGVNQVSADDTPHSLAEDYLNGLPDPTAPAPLSADRTETHTLAEQSTLNKDAPLDTDYGNVFQDDGFSRAGESLSWKEGHGGGSFDDSESSLDQTLAADQTLRDFLLEQITVDIADGRARTIGLILLDHLDDSGWLQADVTSLALQLGCEISEIEQVIARLQKLEPAGIFARSLKECLALQLAEKNRLDPAMQILLDNLDLLGARNWAALQKKCGVDAEDIKDMAAEIRALNPKPAFGFAAPEAPTLIPDALMRMGPDGAFMIELNPDTLPRVLVNERYFIRVKGATQDRSELGYINERFQAANWLLRALNQRANTILKVATEIVRHQEAFFHHGLDYLRPLVLREIAEATGLHESTVSRVTNNKYIATPRGIFELKFFFSVAIAANDGNAAHAAESVRGRIRRLIEGESPEAILSDDQIMILLQKDGVELARRTVAKYRESMNIPSSAARRRQKRA